MVYIIDDEEPIRDSLAWLLKSRGHASRAFASAREFADFMLAVEPADRTPGCLILDIRMPDMSGIELFDQMRTAGLHEIWPVIFLTGHGDVPMAVSSLKSGAFIFLKSRSTTIRWSTVSPPRWRCRRGISTRAWRNPRCNRASPS